MEGTSWRNCKKLKKKPTKKKLKRGYKKKKKKKTLQINQNTSCSKTQCRGIVLYYESL